MPPPMPLKASTLIVVALAVLAAALWFGRDRPAVQQALPAPLREALSPAPTRARPPAAATTQPRKCRNGDQVIYTDGPCPAGTREQALAGGTVTVLPGPAAAAPASAASAVPPLRRLAGDGAGPERASDRSVEQALHR